MGSLLGQKKHGKICTERVTIGFVSLLYFLFNLLYLNQQYPMQNLPDSFNVIACAAFFSGTGNWGESVLTVSAVGQGLIYAPLFWLIKDPTILFRGFLFVNALEITLILPVIYNISKTILGMSRQKCILISITSTVCVDLMAMAKFAWNEPLVALMTWICIFWGIKAFSSSANWTKTQYSCLWGTFVGIGYISHGRFIALIVGFSFSALFLCSIRKKSINLKAYFICLMVSFGAAICLDKYVVLNMYGGDTALTIACSGILENIQSFTFWKNVFYTLIGQFSYLIWSTFGLGLFALLFIVEAQSPAIPRTKRSRCRSSQEVNDSPTPFSALNYCLPALPIASMSLS